MRAEQNTIDKAIAAYNQVTKAHKRSPVEAYIKKRLSEGEEVALSSGVKRWSSALVFSGTPEEMVVEFRINPALPNSFQEQLKKQQQEFLELLEDTN
ncbi:MAG: hypothetical protein ACMXYD_02360 [Candidatus Woesearchaeota archaeon]